MSVGQKLGDTMCPIASDADVAGGFLDGLNQTIKSSKEAYPADVKTNKIGKGSMPRPGVWGNGFCKP